MLLPSFSWLSHQSMPFCRNWIVINCDWSCGSYTRLCSVELLRTDWGRCSEAGLLYVHVTMTHVKCLSYSNSAVFADTVVSSRCHRTIIRWLHDGIARASRSRVAFLRQSGSFLFPSYCLRQATHVRWHRWSHEVKTKMTRFDKMPSRWPYEGQHGHTNSTRKWTFARSHDNVLACQRFCHRSRSCCRSLRNSTGGHTMA